MNVRSSRSHTIFRMVCPYISWKCCSCLKLLLHCISSNGLFFLCVQVIESKGKDTLNDSLSSDDAIRVSVLVCISFKGIDVALQSTCCDP